MRAHVVVQGQAMIVLFTDFGLQGPYTGQMKAVLHQTAPDDLLTTAQLGFLRLNRGDREGALPLLEQVLKGKDPVLADRVREALKLPRTGASNATCHGRYGITRGRSNA